MPGAPKPNPQRTWRQALLGRLAASLALPELLRVSGQLLRQAHELAAAKAALLHPLLSQAPEAELREAVGRLRGQVPRAALNGMLSCSILPQLSHDQLRLVG